MFDISHYFKMYNTNETTMLTEYVLKHKLNDFEHSRAEIQVKLAKHNNHKKHTLLETSHVYVNRKRNDLVADQ